jgi:hypothetical protein
LIYITIRAIHLHKIVYHNDVVAEDLIINYKLTIYGDVAIHIPNRVVSIHFMIKPTIVNSLMIVTDNQL